MNRSFQVSPKNLNLVLIILALALSLIACVGKNMNTEKVIIIGAGPAGMTAGYLLAQQGIDFQILEASSTHGGRIKHTTTFTDFPISLGGEWLHVDQSELNVIVNDPSVSVTTKMLAYTDAETYGDFVDGKLTISPLGDIGDKKFVGGSWLTFFNEYIVPTIQSNILFGKQIVFIDYRGDKVQLLDQHDSVHHADKVIVTVPLKILQRGDIQFYPPLPGDKLAAIEEATVWSGIKVFLAFSEEFYPTGLALPNSDTKEGQRWYYNAAFAESTESNILGLFAVGDQAKQYQALSDMALRDHILAELDAVFEGKASKTYIKHIVQNWDEETFIGAAYLEDYAREGISHILSKPINDKLYFAGEAYSDEDDWGSVHNATRSAKDAVERILGGTARQTGAN